MPAWSPVDLIPGVYFAALALGLHALLARAYDAVPRWVSAAFLAAVFALLGPVLFGGKILLPLDNLRGEVPFRELPAAEPHGNLLQGDLIQLVAPAAVEVRRAYGEGRWPLWNDRAGSGIPLLADPQAQAFQPLVLLGYPLPYVRAAGVTAALRIWIAGTFFFLLLRRQGMGSGSAGFGAASFAFGGFLMLWLGWPIANAAAFLPALLYGITLCAQRGERRDFLLLSLSLLFLLWAGHPETILQVLALGLAWAVALRRQLPLRKMILVAGLALACAAPLLLPAAEALPQSLRASRLREPLPPAPELPRWLPAVAPNAYGNSRYLEYWGPVNSNEDAGGFVGTAALLLALAALPARRRFLQERLVLGGLGVAALLLGIPGLLEQVQSISPLLRAAVTPRLLLGVAFGIAYLAACSLERLQLAEKGERSRTWLALGAAVLAAGLAWAYLAHPHPQEPERFAIFTHGWLRWQLRFLGLAVLLGWIGLRRRRLPAALTLVALTELFLLHRPANPPMPRSLAFPRTPAIRFLQEKAGFSRIAGLGRAFPPGLAGLYGLADARVYNPAAPAGWFAATRPLLARWWGEVPEWQRPKHPLYARLGVRYLLTEPGRRLPPPLVRTFADETVSIWEVPDPHLRFDLRDGKLETRIYQDGHWRLLVERKAAPTRRRSPWVSADLPPGTSLGAIELLYRPGSFLLGLLLAAAGLAGALAGLACPRDLRKR